MTDARPDSLDHIIDRNVEAIESLYINAERKTSVHHRLVERMIQTIGQPVMVYVVLALSLVWMGGNGALSRAGFDAVDAPPYFWMQGFFSLGALVTALMVLSRQNHQQRIARQRSHLELQVNMLAEQKVAKLIDLVEELRRDMPNVRNRHDPVAEAMTETANPETVISALERSAQSVKARLVHPEKGH